MEIIYCDGCGMRISDADLKSGVAVRDAGAARTYCPKCAPASRPTKVLARPSSGENIIHRPNRATPTQIRVPSSAQRTAPAGASADARTIDASTKLMIGGGAAGFLGLVLILLGTRGGKKDPISKVVPKESTRPAVIKPVELEKPKPAEGAPVVNVVKPPESAPQTHPVSAAPVEKPNIPQPKTDPGMDDIRERFAQRKWTELKTEAERAGPTNWATKKRVKDFAATYASTAPGKDALELYKRLSADDPPPPGTNVFAGFKRDFKRETPAPGWRYLWNKDGAITETGKYVPLVWNAKHDGYFSDPEKHPVGMPAGYVSLKENGGHPGGGDKQGAGTDRFTIAAYTLQPGQSGKTAMQGTALRPERGHGGKVDFRVYVNDAMKFSALVSSSTVEYTIELGVLKEGDTVYVVAGPDHDDGSDSYQADFTIYPYP